jgi:hypothetical protein
VSQPAVAQCERAPLRVSAKAAPSLPRITNAINDALKGFGAVLLVSPVLTKSWPRYERQAQILARDETLQDRPTFANVPAKAGHGGPVYSESDRLIERTKSRSPCAL